MFDDERLADNSLDYPYKYHVNIEIPTVVLVHNTSIAVNCILVYSYGT